ncbi:MAG: M28 family peptidase [Woeseiaceae bacterium]|nr:M28 family peptidase [Woeseiaceae bacterium]
MNKRTFMLTISALLFAACATTGSSIDPIDRISAKPLEAHVRWLASDNLEGRRIGEPGYLKSAEYVAKQFEQFGLEPGGTDDWLQPVPLVHYQLDVESPSLLIHWADGDQVLSYRDDYGMAPDKVRTTNSVRGELVYVGYGVHAPEFGYSDYDGIDVRGKIVVLFGGAPSMLPHAERAYYSSGRVKSREAVSRGAIASISLRSRRIQEQLPWRRYKQLVGKRPGTAWVNADGAATDYFPELRGSATISAAAATALLQDAPISFDAALEAAAADRIASTPLGIEVSMSRRTTHEGFSSPNVIGIVRGTDPALAGEYVVYTAHLDHIGRETAPETKDDINNGAYDNAMGISIMLETAKVFAADPPARSVMFIALTGEESGLLGSDYFAHYPTVPIEKIVANINVDMPLFLYPLADLVAFGSEHSSLEGDVALAARAEGFSLTPNPLPEENLFVRSDQYSFVRQGVPSIFLVSGFTSLDPELDGEALFRDHLKNHYHKPSDDLSRPVDWPSAVRFTRSHIRIGYAVANATARPTWNDGDFFGERFAPK